MICTSDDLCLICHAGGMCSRELYRKDAREIVMEVIQDAIDRRELRKMQRRIAERRDMWGKFDPNYLDYWLNL